METAHKSNAFNVPVKEIGVIAFYSIFLFVIWFFDNRTLCHSLQMKNSLWFYIKFTKETSLNAHPRIRFVR